MSRIQQAILRAQGELGPENAVSPDADQDTAPPAGSGLNGYRHEIGARAPERPREQVSLPPGAAPREALEPSPRVGMSRSNADRKLVVAADASPIWVEQYRRLAATLYQAQSESAIKTVMVSSSLPREGKTLTVSNLALTLSESYKQRVLLIDADLRNPSVHSLFGMPNGAGLSDYLLARDGQAPIVSVSPTLSIVPGGRATGNPIAGLVSDRMKRLVESAGSQFDWVLLDTPPVGLLPDANLLARLTDAVVFVIAASISRYPIVQRALAAVGPERVIGVVLNRADDSELPASTHYSHYSAPATGPWSSDRRHG